MFKKILGVMFMASVMCCTSSTLLGQIRHDENVPADMKAVIAVNIDIQALAKNDLMAEIFEMAAAEESEMPFAITDITKISALFAAPKGIDEESLEKTEGYVYVGFKDAEIAASIKQLMIEAGGEQVTVGGKSLIAPPEFMLPPGFLVDIQGKYMVAGTKSYMASASNQFASKGLADAYAKMPKAPIRVAIDFDGARGVLDQASAMAKAAADPFTKPYVSLIDEVSSITITSDIDKDSLLKISLSGHNEDEGDKIKLKLDALIGLAKGFAGTIPAGPTESAILDSAKDIAPVQNGASVSVELTKPAGFEETISQMVKAARGAATKISDINNFRQATIAVLNYNDVYNKLPFEKHCAGEDSGKGLSWAVHILPFMEQEAVARTMDLEGDFDSPKNAAAAKLVIPSLTLKTGGQIRFIRPKKVPAKFSDLVDGSSNTAVFVQSRKVTMSPWTKAVSITPAEVLAEFKALKDGESMIVAMYDGSAFELNKQTDVADVEAILDPADGKTPKNLASQIEDQFFDGPPGDDEFEDFSKKEDTEERPRGDDDPFGAPKKAVDDDPFGAPKKAVDDDPFGAPKKSGDDDPFGAPSKEEKKSDDDPFKASNDDPFGK